MKIDRVENQKKVMREWYWIWSICSAKSFTVAIYLLVDCFMNFKNMTRYFPCMI